MKRLTQFSSWQFPLCLILALCRFHSNSLNAQSSTASQPSPAPIALDQLGAVAGKQYHGDGLSITATPAGARLRCAFQRLEGQATGDGLWLSSTAEDAAGERFRVMAVEVGREAASVAADVSPLHSSSEGVSADSRRLLPMGVVALEGHLVRFTRSGLTEEYSVSVDGVRQDFIVAEQPEGDGQLRVELAVTGAMVEPLINGVRLTLNGSGRKLAYSRLRVTDATGRELPARFEVASGILPDEEGAHPAARKPAFAHGPGWEFSDRLESSSVSAAGLEAPALRQAGMPAATMFAVLVDDTAANYPVRIDPTFSDEDWSSLGGSLGVSMYGSVSALAVSGSELYVGGSFTNVTNSVGGVITVNKIAKWDGNSWSALGLGLDGSVTALVVLGSDLYVGGIFTTATNSGGGAITVNNIAKWNGNSWSALGAGLDGAVGFGNIVYALAVSGSNVYAGGGFFFGDKATYIARWNGNSWSVLASGMVGYVKALAVSDSNLYAGGYFTTVGGSAATNIARWDGNSWSALGSGVVVEMFSPSIVNALVVSGNDLYAGGMFTTMGGLPVNGIAKWDGSSWSALDSGMGIAGSVSVLAVSGSDLYAGGNFTTAGGIPANRIAKWDGNNWSALGSGVAGGDFGGGSVGALALSGSSLYAGGSFTNAGGKISTYIAKANIGGNVSPGEFGSLIYSPVAGFSFTFSGGTVGQAYRIQTSPSSVVGPWMDFTNFTYTGPIGITDPAAGSGSNKFFRAVTP